VTKLQKDPNLFENHSYHGMCAIFFFSILLYSTLYRWNMEAVFRPEIVRIFSGGFLPTFCAFRQESGGKHWKKSEKFTAGILLPQNHRNYPETVFFGSDCSTWDIQSLIARNVTIGGPARGRGGSIAPPEKISRGQ
jgi:hypothetical protein